jgi:hypothetical protein
VSRMIVGLALTTPDDAVRLQHGAAIFDGLYRSFGGRPFPSDPAARPRGTPGGTHQRRKP